MGAATKRRPTSTLTRLAPLEFGKLALDVVDVVVGEVVVALRLQRVRRDRGEALLRRLRARRGVRAPGKLPEGLGRARGQHLADGPRGLGAGDELRHLPDRLGQLAAVVLQRRRHVLRHQQQVDHRFPRMRACKQTPVHQLLLK